jgi:cytochrome c biogenesis protein CcmG/thiol:disulfide interchange protein DsbE
LSTKTTPPAEPTSRGNNRWWWLAGALLALGLTTAVVLASRFGNDPAFVDSPLIGQPVPDLTLERIDGGQPISLRDLSGNISVINFWASYCFPCREEHGLLTEAAVQFGDVNFLGVVWNDTPDRANEFLDEYGRTYPQVLDPDLRGAISFGVFGPPETYFIDASGTIVAKITGPLQAGVLEDTLNRIILGERPGSRTLGTVYGQQDT